MDEDACGLFNEQSLEELAAALSRIPTCREDYARADFWRNRYAAEAAAGAAAESFVSEEWYSTTWHAVVSACEEAGVSLKGAVVLQLGCGVSSLGAQLSQAGAAVVLDSDIDPALLATLRRKAGCGGGVTFAALDATCLGLRAGVVDLVVEKGTLDALQCSAGEGELCRLAAREALRCAPRLLSLTANAPKLLATLKPLGLRVEAQMGLDMCTLLVLSMPSPSD